jgi:hypothetical protein
LIGVADREERRHRLRCREREIERMDLNSVGTQRSSIDWMLAIDEEAMKRAVRDRAMEAELVGAGAHPLALTLTLAGVVVLTPAGDRALVVVDAGCSAGELPDAQHRRWEA